MCFGRATLKIKPNLLLVKQRFMIPRHRNRKRLCGVKLNQRPRELTRQKYFRKCLRSKALPMPSSSSNQVSYFTKAWQTECGNNFIDYDGQHDTQVFSNRTMTFRRTDKRILPKQLRSRSQAKEINNQTCHHAIIKIQSNQERATGQIYILC